jgi:hypothetical protein
MRVGGGFTIGSGNDTYKNMQTSAFLQFSPSYSEVCTEHCLIQKIHLKKHSGRFTLKFTTEPEQ